MDRIHSICKYLGKMDVGVFVFSVLLLTLAGWIVNGMAGSGNGCIVDVWLPQLYIVQR